MKQRPQHFSTYLAQNGYTVLYLSLTDANKININELRCIHDKHELLNQLFEKNIDGVYVLRNLNTSINFFNNPLTEIINKIDTFHKRFGIIYFIGFPKWMEHLSSISSQSTIIYDCMDEWEEFKKNDLNIGSEELIYYERKLASVAHLVITSSKKLYLKMSYFNTNVYYLPNGVWINDFKYDNHKEQIPDDLKNIKKPIVFFMGAIAEWVDIELIEYIAKSRPKYSFVFVGPKRCDLPHLPNIYKLGYKNYDMLPQYLFQSKVAIIPFKVNNLTAAVTPLKLYEYLASGTPVVTTILPDIIGLAGTRTALSYEEFIQYIDEFVLMQDDTYEDEVKQAIQTAKSFEWQQLLEPITLFIENNNWKINSREDTIKETLEIYYNYSKSDLIKNEMLGMYNFLGWYDKSCSLFDFNIIKNQIIQVDYEKLALAHLSCGNLDVSIQLLEMYLQNPKHKILETYVSYLLEESQVQFLLKVYLLKLSGNIYEALKLVDRLIEEEGYTPRLLGLLAGLYLDVGEFDVAFELAMQAISTIDQSSNIIEILDPYVLKFIIKYFSKHKQFTIAEEFALSLINTNEVYEEFFLSILSDVYFEKNSDI